LHFSYFFIYFAVLLLLFTCFDIKKLSHLLFLLLFLYKAGFHQADFDIRSVYAGIKQFISCWGTNL
jgi:hypothetical protein